MSQESGCGGAGSSAQGLTGWDEAIGRGLGPFWGSPGDRSAGKLTKVLVDFSSLWLQDWGPQFLDGYRVEATISSLRPPRLLPHRVPSTTTCILTASKRERLQQDAAVCTGTPWFIPHSVLYATDASHAHRQVTWGRGSLLHLHHKLILGGEKGKVKSHFSLYEYLLAPATRVKNKFLFPLNFTGVLGGTSLSL